MIIEEETNYAEIAKKRVEDYYNAYVASPNDPSIAFVKSEQVYLVWFTKVLKNWKALVGTTNPDGMYFEITFNGEKNETYIDHYVKYHNITLYDSK